MSIHPSATRRAVAVLVTLGLMLVAGCGDDDSSSSDPASPDPSVEPTPADDDPADDHSADEAGQEHAAGGELPDACGLLDQAEIEALIGPAVSEREEGQTLDGLNFSQCVWENDDSGQLVGMALTTTTTRFDSHVDNLSGDPVAGLGDDAVTMGGVSLETTGATGGRTISIAHGDRTVVVGLRIDGQTTVDMVRPLADSVLAALGAG